MATTEDRGGLTEKLAEIAREAVRRGKGDFEKAVVAFAGKVEADPTLLVALVGRREVTRTERAFVQQVILSDQGRKLREGVGRVDQESDEEKAAAERRRAVREDARALMWTFLVPGAGKPLALCTRAEIEREASHSRQLARFYQALLSALPAIATAVVKDVLTPKQAETMLRDHGLAQ